MTNAIDLRKARARERQRLHRERKRAERRPRFVISAHPTPEEIQRIYAGTERAS